MRHSDAFRIAGDLLGRYEHSLGGPFTAPSHSSAIDPGRPRRGSATCGQFLIAARPAACYAWRHHRRMIREVATIGS